MAWNAIPIRPRPHASIPTAASEPARVGHRECWPRFPNHVWSYDFVHDRTYNGAAYRILNIIDETSREALLMRVQRRMYHKDVLEALSWLFLLRSVSALIRSDNGSEFTAQRARH